MQWNPKHMWYAHGDSLGRLHFRTKEHKPHLVEFYIHSRHLKIFKVGEKGRLLIFRRERRDQPKWNFTFIKNLEKGEKKGAQHTFTSVYNKPKNSTA